MAPDFTLPDQEGKIFKLSSNRGRKTVLYFYPKDNTTGCTLQSCNLRDHYESLQRDGYDVYGISTDGLESHRKFISDYQLPYRLLADVQKSVVRKYDVYSEPSFFGRKLSRTTRTTFVIGETGQIEKVITDVDTGDHATQITTKQP